MVNSEGDFNGLMLSPPPVTQKDCDCVVEFWAMICWKEFDIISCTTTLNNTEGTYKLPSFSKSTNAVVFSYHIIKVDVQE